MLIQDGSNGRIYYDDLPPSNYSVIVEGIECDMEISTTIAGTFPCPDGYSEIGEYDTYFIYSENEYMDGYPNLVGTELGDIVYKVTLKVPMIINVSHDGSVELHTSIHLWNVEMQEIGNNNSNTSDVPCSVSTQASMQIYLQKGVYYIISESLEAYNDNYSRTIKTTIEGILPSEMLGDTAQNYIYTRTMINKEGTSFMDKIQYFDGLGYPVELVERKASPSKHDIITYQEYDEYHRESKSWLPRVGTDGSGRFVALENFQTLSPEIYNGDTKAYAKPIYEESQLNRLVEQYGAGEDWHNQHKRIKTARMTNILGNDTLNCILFKVDNEYIKDTLLTLRADGNYESYQLFVTRTEDEDGNRIFEFKDKLGRLVLNRLMQGNEALDTYYI